MKSLFISCAIMSFLLVGCSQEKSYSLWIDSSQGQKTINSAKENFSNAGIDFIVDEKGNLLINEKDMDKAVYCCS